MRRTPAAAGFATPMHGSGDAQKPSLLSERRSELWNGSMEDLSPDSRELFADLEEAERGQKQQRRPTSDRPTFAFAPPAAPQPPSAVQQLDFAATPQRPAETPAAQATRLSFSLLGSSARKPRDMEDEEEVEDERHERQAPPRWNVAFTPDSAQRTTSSRRPDVADLEDTPAPPSRPREQPLHRPLHRQLALQQQQQQQRGQQEVEEEEEEEEVVVEVTSVIDVASQDGTDEDRERQQQGQQAEQVEEEEEDESLRLARQLMAEEESELLQRIHEQQLEALQALDNQSSADVALALEMLAEERALQGGGGGDEDGDEDSDEGDDPDDMSYEQLLELGERIGNVKQERWRIDGRALVAALAVEVFAPSEDATGDTLCVVCQCDFEAGDRIKRLPCAHGFHEECIDPWLRDHDTCVTCKRSLREPDGG